MTVVISRRKVQDGVAHRMQQEMLCTRSLGSSSLGWGGDFKKQVLSSVSFSRK